MVNSHLISYLDKCLVKYKMCPKTADLVSFRVGGKCQVAIYPKNINELVEILEIVKNQKFVILGKGSNCYFTSGIYDGAVIVTSNLNKISFSDNIISAQCGTSVSSLCRLAYLCSLSGVEFAYGIPGSVGGAVCMNASAYGGCFSQIVLKSTVLDIKSGKIFDIDNSEHCFKTKWSVFFDKSLCLLKTDFLLEKSDQGAIYDKMNAFLAKRRENQPLDMPSAGSTFVRPKDNYASLLIDRAGLKGFTIGGAQVSTKHAGFIVNIGNATSGDVQALIKHIKKTVLEKYNIELKEEIIYLE